MKAIFFLRQFGDIDHITPVIDQWVRIHNLKAQVILYSVIPGPVPIYQKFNLLEDFRIKYMRDILNLPVNIINDFCTPGTIFNSNEEMLEHAAENIINKLMPENEPKILVFDWHYESLPLYAGKIARQRNIASISICHAAGAVVPECALHATDDLGENRHISQYEGGAEVKDIFDVHVNPNSMMAERAHPAYKSIVKVLGCPRYSKDWIERLSLILPPLEVNVPPGTLKVAVFPRSFAYPIFWEEFARSLKIITDNSNAVVIVHHHTSENFLLNNVSDQYAALNRVIQERPNQIIALDYSYQATSIVRWSDVVVDLATSTAYEAIVTNKPVLEMEYLHALYSPIARDLPVTHMHCRDHLYLWMKKFAENPKIEFYDQNERAEFIKRMITPAGENVSELYVEMMKNTAERIYSKANSLT